MFPVPLVLKKGQTIVAGTGSGIPGSVSPTDTMAAGGDGRFEVSTVTRPPAGSSASTALIMRFEIASRSAGPDTSTTALVTPSTWMRTSAPPARASVSYWGRVSSTASWTRSPTKTGSRGIGSSPMRSRTRRIMSAASFPILVKRHAVCPLMGNITSPDDSDPGRLSSKPREIRASCTESSAGQRRGGLWK